MNDTGEAARLIKEADFPEIRIWFDVVAGAYKPEVHGSRPSSLEPPVLPLTERKKPRMPSSKTTQEVVARDGMHCRFCNGPVIPKNVVLALSSRYPAEARWSSDAKLQHRFLQAMTLQYDHVVPHSRGGESSTANIVIACAACNYGRSSWTVEEAGLLDPRTQPIIRTAWNGLADFLTT
ncbi:MAG: HNH endonuclease signature motif containing protein [Hyphomonas sp.]|nr:HNH endonuclease signature motif containing protein [Hyphomonas sp.]